MFKILPFKPDSTGAEILSREIPAERIDPNDATSIRSISRSDVVINWGCGWTNRVPVAANQPKAICNAVDKFRAFECFNEYDVPHPSCTRNASVAKRWLQASNRVYGRTTMQGERGRGIKVFGSEDLECFERELHQYVAFTKGFPIHREFRVHVAFGQVIEVNEKKRRNGTNPDPLVRSHRDWVFCVYNLQPYPEIIKDTAVLAVESLGLDFGGVDLAIDRENNITVFEVNTAPWINRESSTLAYVKAFKEKFPEAA